MISRRTLLSGITGFAGLLTAQGGAVRAGTAWANITPALGTSMSGGMRDRRATDIHDELHAKAIVVESGGKRLAMVVCDSCAIATEAITQAKDLIRQAAGIASEDVLVSATHSHTAATGARLFQSEPDPEYLKFLTVRIRDAVQRAALRMEPVSVGWGKGSVPHQLFNRRFYMQPDGIPEDPFGRRTDQVLMNPGVGNPKAMKPAGPTDPDLPVLVFRSVATGKPVAALASYALHYVGGIPGTVISADYFALVDKPLILANACSGDVNNVDVMGAAGQKKYANYEKMAEVARDVSREAFRVIEQVESRPSAVLRSAFEWVTLATRRPTTAEVEAARAMLPADSRDVSDRRHIYAKETLDLANWPATVRAPVQALRIGDMAIATMPGEAFTELGIAVKKQSPFALTMMIELANGYFGYIPTAEGHRLGGYETWRAKSAYLAPGTGEQLVDAAVRCLQKVA